MEDKSHNPQTLMLQKNMEDFESLQNLFSIELEDMPYVVFEGFKTSNLHKFAA
jgi:molybdopterin-guanine dinucleotide biosynthesis protein